MKRYDVVAIIAQDMIDYMDKFNVDLEEAIDGYSQPLTAEQRAIIRNRALLMLDAQAPHGA